MWSGRQRKAETIAHILPPSLRINLYQGKMSAQKKKTQKEYKKMLHKKTQKLRDYKKIKAHFQPIRLTSPFFKVPKSMMVPARVPPKSKHLRSCPICWYSSVEPEPPVHMGNSTVLYILHMFAAARFS